METGMLHLHKTVVIVFILLLLFKTSLLLANKIDLLDKVRQKTKVLDMIFGTLLLATGIYLLVTLPEGMPSYLVIKLILVFSAIPLGIIGIAKKKKPLALVSVLIFIYVFGIAQTRSITWSKPNLPSLSAGEPLVKQTKEIYNELCARCHGENGDLGRYKAADLTKTELSLEERAAIIANGKGSMVAYKGVLNNTQINALANYIEELKK